MLKTLTAVFAALALFAPATADAKCHTRACNKRVYQKHTIHPYIPWLRSTGDCENGPYGGRALKSGLRAYNSSGPYMGRYQFDSSSWDGAGGHGDPRDAGWLEQAFRAVRWRQKVGPSAWPVCG